MAMFKPANKLDRIFEISIILKALDGLLEVIGGILILLISPDTVNHIAHALTQHELAQDPHDFIASHILHSAQAFTTGTRLFASVYLLSHGLAKVVLVVEILRGRLWAYKGLIALLIAFIVYQLYRISYKPSIGLILLTIFDAFVLVLTIREDRRLHSVKEGA